VNRLVSRFAPFVLGLGVLAVWEIAVRLREVPSYILPGPLLILRTIVADAGLLFPSLWATLEVAFLALLASVIVGVAIAAALAQARWLEAAFLPYVIVLQVTPIVAIAPLIIVWVENARAALVLCAWIVAVFPIIANTLIGLKSVPDDLEALFRLHRATRWQRLRLLQAPTALPHFFTGLRISGGLALIGAIVAEFVAGTGGEGSGLAYRILEAGYRLQVPRMFAALVLLSAAGVLIYVALDRLARVSLRRWHESARGAAA
jgi:NitT/TauT family transport system permease protein